MGTLLILFLLLFIFLALIRLDWALMLVIFSLPVYQIRFHLAGVPFTLLEAMILLTFTVWFFTETKARYFVQGKYSVREYFAARHKRRAYPFGWEAILLVIIAFVGVYTAGFSNAAWGIWKAYFFEPVLFFIMLINVFQDKKSLAKIIWPLFLSVFLVCLFAIYQKFTGLFIFNNLWAAELTRRVTGFFPYPNALALYVMPIAAIMIVWCLKILFSANNRHYFKKAAQIFFLILIIILVLFAVYFAHSEGALIGFSAAVFFMFLFAFSERPNAWPFMRKVFRWFFALFFVAVFAYPLVALWVIPEYVYPDFGNKSFNYIYDKIALKDFSGEIRKQQWRETWQMLKKRGIFFGAGLSAYQQSVWPYHQEGIYFNKERDPDFRRKIVIFNQVYRDKHWRPVEIYMYPHSIFLNFWSELGILGALLFVWLIGKYFYQAINLLLQAEKDKYLLLGLIGAMIVVIVHGIVDVPYFKNDLAIIFWIFIALLSLMKLNLENKQGQQIKE